MSALLRVTGIGKLITFYKYIYFNGPGVVKWSGIGLLLMTGLIHMYELPEHFEAAKYIGLSFGALFAGTLLATWGILLGRRWGWTLGSVISGVAFVAYIVSRAWGLPGFEMAVANWDEPAGTVAMAFEAAFIFLHFSIITGMNVASPETRDWHD